MSLAVLDDGGVYYATVIEVCAILADFHYDGLFSLMSTDTRIDCYLEVILTEPNYYFHIPDLKR